MSSVLATNNAFISLPHRHFLFRRFHSLTGLVFGGYLIVHLLINATLAQGGTHYQVQVDKIHSLPFLPAFEWGLIYLPILFHTFYGIVVALSGRWNTSSYPYGKNIFYVMQRISSIVIVLFMFFHIFALKYGWFGANLTFAPDRATYTVVRHMHSSWIVIWLIYPMGILASCYHLSNGFWTAAITWGLTTSKASQRRFGYACLGLFLVTFVAGMTALVAAAADRPGVDNPAWTAKE